MRIWIGGEKKDKSFRWVDRSKFDYRNWYLGEPNNAAGDENCIEAYQNAFYKWNDFACGIEKAYFCKKRC